MPSPSLDTYGYEAKAGRFRSLTTGRYVPTQDVRDLVQSEITAGYQRISNLADNVVSGRATVGQLQDAMISHLRTSHIASYTLGKGGIAQMTPNDYGNLTAFLEQEYTYLEGFMADVQNGNLSAAQVKARLNQYADAIWTTYSTGENEGASAAGYTEERRIAKDDGGTCDDCHDYAAQGWQPIGTLPKPGERSKCRRRCRCEFEYRTTASANATGRVRLRTS